MLYTSPTTDPGTNGRHIAYGLIPAAISFILFTWGTLRPPTNQGFHTLVLTLAGVAAIGVIGVWIWSAVQRARGEIQTLSAEHQALAAELKAWRRSADKLCKSNSSLHKKVDALSREQRRLRRDLELAYIEDVADGQADVAGDARPISFQRRSPEQGRR